MCSILEIDPAVNNGSFANVSPLLFNSSTDVRTDLKSESYSNNNKCVLESDVGKNIGGGGTSFGSLMRQLFTACKKRTKKFFKSFFDLYYSFPQFYQCLER